MVRSAYIVSALLIAASPVLADPGHEVDFGGVVGGAASNEVTTAPCTVLRAPAAPGDCVGKPHYDEQGVVLGAHLRYAVASFVSVEGGLTYAEKGYNAGVEVHLHYIEAPLLVRLHPPIGTTPLRVFLAGGLAPAVLVACRESGQIFDNNPPPHAVMYSGSCADVPGLDQTPDRFDLSAVLGGGVGWRFGFGTVEIEARVVRGLIDVDGWSTSGKTINDATYVVAGFDRKL